MLDAGLQADAGTFSPPGRMARVSRDADDAIVDEALRRLEAMGEDIDPAIVRDMTKTFLAFREIGIAGYPEGHPQCLNRTRDMEHLKRKVDNGGCFIITQLFFDNADFYRFRDEARAMAIKVPIVAGIMPITNVSQIKRFVSMCGAKIPHRLLTKLEALDENPDTVHKFGVDYAAMQCEDLLFNEVEGLHFYTLNKSKATVEIVKALNIDHVS